MSARSNFGVGALFRKRELQRVRKERQHLRKLVEQRTLELREKNQALEQANIEIFHQLEIQTQLTREIESANARLQAHNELLEKLNRDKDELMSIVAHDLKNPMGAVRSYAEMIQNNLFHQSELPQVSEQMLRIVDRMLGLVKNLLDSNSLESGAIEFHPVLFDISAFVECSVCQSQYQAAEKNIAVYYSPATFSSLVFADERATMQVLDNILSNAIKYSPSGKKVFVRMTQHDTVVRVEVRDEGPGLTEEDKLRLFGKFARLSAKPTGGEHSTGLGLNIVKKMVEAMNGRVWCESELGRGATFIVELPASPPEEYLS